MDIKKDFPIFKNAPKQWSYLDSGATTQKPKAVIEAIKKFYERGNSNIHRSDYLLARKTTDLYEGVRSKLSGFLQCKQSEVFFTKNTNEAFNIIVRNCQRFVSEKSVVVLSRMEHNANVVPWLMLKQYEKFEIYWLDYDKDFNLQYQNIPPEILERVRIVSLTHVSNVTGTINPLKEIFSYFRQHSKQYVICIGDGAQAVGHFQVNLWGGDKTTAIEPDFYAFSGHKMYAPSGVGVLFAKIDDKFPLEPIVFGSHMVTDVTDHSIVFADYPDRMEAGTANIEGVYGLGVAIDYLWSIGWVNIQAHEKELVRYALEKYTERNCKLLGSLKSSKRLGIFSFYYDKIHSHDVASGLDTMDVCVRSGNHCAPILMHHAGLSGVSRASIGMYNTKKDIDNLMKALVEVERFYHI